MSHQDPVPDEPKKETDSKQDARNLSRRWFLVKLGVAFNAAVGLAVTVPVLGYLLGPVKKHGYRSWISLGAMGTFPAGETRLAEFMNPSGHPWDGMTAKTACWVRHVSEEKFQVFAINCAHLGCPVRWFAQSQLFLCPCHGGAYYADGSQAAGPPERGLFEYPYKVVNGELMIDAGQMPTLANEARLYQIDGKDSKPCVG
ncbi:MAG TPA: Rieske 2Fe-2S domain-containing protein [Acidobacteriaceae bacterium]|jgi:Rieske Fe-S protein|nr:Rieske 2Fe-2S domain-containing protein [Acidobacteriaceae bacterium]